MEDDVPDLDMTALASALGHLGSDGEDMVRAV